MLLELDSRRRASLGRIAKHAFYFVRVEEDGTIVLTPALVMTPQEASEKGLDGTPTSG